MKIKIILASIGIAALLMVIAEGVRGLIVNIKTDELVYLDYTEFVKDPGQYKHYMVRVDSVHILDHPAFNMNDKDYRILPAIIGEDTEEKQGFRFFIKFDPNTNLRMGKDSGITVTGILKSLKQKMLGSGFSDASLIGPDPLVIDTYQSPRAWYWNILLLLVPQIFIYLLANTIYLLVKRKSS
jgi:hypothetical protein